MPSTFSLQMQLPFSASHLGWLSRLPAKLQPQGLHPVGPKSKWLLAHRSHFSPVTPARHRQLPSALHCKLHDPGCGMIDADEKIFIEEKKLKKNLKNTYRLRCTRTTNSARLLSAGNSSRDTVRNWRRPDFRRSPNNVRRVRSDRTGLCRRNTGARTRYSYILRENRWNSV